MCKILFEGFSVEAITQWAQVRGGADFDPKTHEAAVEEGLVAVINGMVCAAPATKGCVHDWATNLRAVQEAGYVTKPLPEAQVCREFGTSAATPGEIRGCPLTIQEVGAEVSPVVVEAMSALTDDDEELTAAEDEVPVADEADEANESPVDVEEVLEVATEPEAAPEPEPPAPPKLNDELRARVASLPPYYAALKEPLNKLIDIGADSLVIDTAVDLAGKPYNLGQIADYARHIVVNSNTNRDLMMVVQAAHRAACKVENTSDANAVIMEKILAMTPAVKRSAMRLRLEQHIKEGLDKYWAEAFGQVEAAQASGRTSTPVNLFTHIVSDMQRNSDLAEKRVAQRINSFAECRWIMDYLPKTPVVYEDDAMARGGRRYYLPKLRETVERMGYIPLTWVMTLMVDNDYPVIALASVAERMSNKYPVLKRIVTREQFEYAVKVVIETFIDRAARWRESWDYECSYPSLCTTLTHHAVFAGYQYLQTFKEHLEAGAPFMQEHKDALLAIPDTTIEALRHWYMNQNPWRHGKTPEAALEHYNEEKAYEARAAARAAEKRRSHN
jgi:hypothetical protein